MATSLLFNRVKVSTTTTGTGTVTLGAAIAKYCTFAEAGVANSNVVTYLIEEGNDFEIGRGTYTSSGTTLSRDTVLLSKISGTSGTSKMNLAGLATVSIIAAKEDLDVNDFTEDTTPDGSADFHWMHDASAAQKKKVKPANVSRTGGMQLLASGSVSSAASLDIVLTSYTGYRGIVVELINFIPATDSVGLYCRVSTNGGSSYDSGASDYKYAFVRASSSANFLSNTSSAGAAQLLIGDVIGNGSSEGIDATVKFVGQANTAIKPKVRFEGALYEAGDILQRIFGGGHRNTAQDTDAIQFLFSSGNIASGTYAVYGLI